ncbi:MAG: hypothetical protein RLZZ371_343 [Pseudomonadota bacterium]
MMLSLVFSWFRIFELARKVYLANMIIRTFCDDDTCTMKMTRSLAIADPAAVGQ